MQRSDWLLVFCLCCLSFGSTKAKILESTSYVSAFKTREAFTQVASVVTIFEESTKISVPCAKTGKPGTSLPSILEFLGGCKTGRQNSGRYFRCFGFVSGC